MLNALGLGWVFKAKDEASHVAHHVKEGIEEVSKSAEHANTSMLGAIGKGAAGIAAAAVAIAAVGAGAAFEFAEHAEQFSHAIREAGVASHATAEQMHELEELALKKGMDSLRASSIDAAQTLAELAKEGMNANAAGEALNGTMMLTRISMGALGSRDAAAIVNDTLGQFGMRADQAGELTDKLAFAMKNFGFRAEELRGTMVGLASGAQLTGASLDDTLIAVGLVKSVFPSATKAAMSMNAAMQQLASTHGQKELKGIGVVVADSTGKMRPLIDILDQIAHKTEHMTEAQIAHRLATIAGGRAAGGLSAIMDGLRKGVRDASGNLYTGAAAVAFLRKQIAESGGTAEGMAEILSDDLGGALKALKAGFSNLGVVIGVPFEDFFKGIVLNLNLFVRGIAQLFSQGGFTGEVKDALDKHLGIKGFAIGVFMWIKRIQNFLGSLGDSFMSTFKTFGPILDELFTAFRQLGQALGIVDQTASDNASVFDSFGSAGAGLGEILAGIAGTVIPLVTGAIQLLTGAVQIAREIWSELSSETYGFGEIFKGVFELLSGILTGDSKKMWDGFVDIVIGALKAVLKIVTGVVGAIAGLFDQLADSFGFDSGLKQSIDDFQKQAAAGLDVMAVKVKGVVDPTAAPAAPAVAQQAGIMRGPSAEFRSAAQEVIHNHTTVNIDGEKLLEVHSAAKRSAKARSFEPVPAHGG